MTLLDQINTRDDLLALDYDKLPQLCEEIRTFLVESVSKTGGHLASNLGVVELTVALERIFDTSKDRLLFDVGHQSYVHKLLTGRKKDFATLRCLGGMAGFPKPSESPCDAFVAGHASSSVSTALGMARARTRFGQDHHVIALIGDGAMTGGLAYEAMNDAGECNEPLIVILNDNGMSINPNVGGFSKYLSFLRTRPGYFRVKKMYRSVTNALPGGKSFFRFTAKMKDRYKGIVLGTTLFEEMGFEYYGPIDGHDIEKLEYMLKLAKECKKPVLLHVITQKGKGYKPAEDKPHVFHGIGVFDPEDGTTKRKGEKSFSDTFGDTLCEIAEKDPRVCAITAAMINGTGMGEFAKKFPDRCLDVGIAEGHAVSMAGGFAMAGGIPVVAVYSTFLQRAYDMILQDVAMQNLHVVFAVDRAGLVGSDGETHQGIFDISFLRSIPNMQILCPSNQAELKVMLNRAVFDMEGPVVVRYPRGCDGKLTEIVPAPVMRKGKDITLIGYGILMNEVIAAGEILAKQGINAEVIKLNSVKPIDLDTIADSVQKTGHLIVAEETVRNGCVGREITALLRTRNILVPTITCNVGDAFIEHGTVPELYKLCGLDAASLAKTAREMLGYEA